MSESVLSIREQMKLRQAQTIQSLQPGRWLDALIAEYVMGYIVEEWKLSDEDPIDYGYRVNYAMTKLSDQEAQRVPNYSTVVFAAMQIIPQFKFWAIEGNQEQQEVRARLSNNEQLSEFWTTSPSIPEAICKAALIGLTHDNKLILKLLNE